MDTLTFCETILGPSNKASHGGDEYEFRCPGCNNFKLGVNIDKMIYHCLICGAKDSTSWAEKFRASRNGKFYGSGPLQLLAAYFHKEDLLSGKTNEYSAPRVYSETKANSLPLTKFRLFLTELFLEPKLSPSHTEFLHDRGFTQKYWAEKGVAVDWDLPDLKFFSASLALEKAKSICTKQELKELNVLREDNTVYSWLNNRILIPYYSPNSNFVLGVRGRSTLLRPKTKYISPPGLATRRLIYNLPDLLKSDTVLLSEGELKSLYASLFGIPCVSLPGVTVGHDVAIEYFVRYGIKKVIVCFDTESLEGLEGDKLLSKTKAKEAVENSWLSLKYLGEQNNIVMRRLILPDEGKKVDIDSFILEHGPTEFIDMVNEIVS